MSQIALPPVDRIEALRRFGYNAREAEFLSIAALHGGYFVRPQFARFLGRAMGGTASTLIEKLMARGHARATALARSTILYHLRARPFYAALGQEDNRNRRHKQPLTIKNRLMALDFVLEHRDKTFLATEQDKTEYFAGRGIPLSKLPKKIYGAAPGTARYFVDKYPIHVSEHPTFAFVDEGLTTASHFETFLSQYRELFRCLGRFHVVYVAASPLPFRWAEPTFERFKRKLSPSAGESDGARLAAHFEMRRQVESKELTGFDGSKLIQFRNDRRTFSGPKYDALFTLWKRDSSLAVGLAGSVEMQSVPGLQGSFSTYLLRGHYDYFGTLTAF